MPRSIKATHQHFAADHQRLYHGYLKTLLDAFLVVEGAISRRIGRVTHKPTPFEKREMVKSGSIVIWNDSEVDMQRWTDGLKWSQSRIDGSYNIYREAITEDPRDKYGSRQCIPMSREAMQYTGNLGERTPCRSSGSWIAENGLIKRAITISPKDGGPKWHIVSYALLQDILSGALHRPSQDPRLKRLIPTISEWMLEPSQHPKVTLILAQDSSGRRVYIDEEKASRAPRTGEDDDHTVFDEEDDGVHEEDDGNGEPEYASSSNTTPAEIKSEFNSPQCDPFTASPREMSYDHRPYGSHVVEQRPYGSQVMEQRPSLCPTLETSTSDPLERHQDFISPSYPPGRPSYDPYLGPSCPIAYHRQSVYTPSVLTSIEEVKPQLPSSSVSPLAIAHSQLILAPATLSIDYNTLGRLYTSGSIYRQPQESSPPSAYMLQSAHSLQEQYHTADTTPSPTLSYDWSTITSDFPVTPWSSFSGPSPCHQTYYPELDLWPTYVEGQQQSPMTKQGDWVLG
ncbi:hypothetical protein FRB93_011896 [Tulasnella sp. JGI-2019a]|nr:hypothetical protein FRB93_011896 [Tulasnella sp. JGI-2019a]